MILKIERNHRSGSSFRKYDAKTIMQNVLVLDLRSYITFNEFLPKNLLKRFNKSILQFTADILNNKIVVKRSSPIYIYYYALTGPHAPKNTYELIKNKLNELDAIYESYVEYTEQKLNIGTQVKDEITYIDNSHLKQRNEHLSVDVELNFFNQEVLLMTSVINLFNNFCIATNCGIFRRQVNDVALHSYDNSRIGYSSRMIMQMPTYQMFENNCNGVNNAVQSLDRCKLTNDVFYLTCPYTGLPLYIAYNDEVSNLNITSQIFDRDVIYHMSYYGDIKRDYDSLTAIVYANDILQPIHITDETDFMVEIESAKQKVIDYALANPNDTVLISTNQIYNRLDLRGKMCIDKFIEAFLFNGVLDYPPNVMPDYKNTASEPDLYDRFIMPDDIIQRVKTRHYLETFYEKCEIEPVIREPGSPRSGHIQMDIEFINKIFNEGLSY